MILEKMEGRLAKDLAVEQSLLKEAWKDLGQALCREALFCPVFQTPVVDTSDDKVVTPSLRDAAITGLRYLNTFYGFHSETFALAVNLVDQFLAKVKALPKHMTCITITCYLIALQTLQDEQEMPSPTEVISLTQSGCTVSDLVRMECIVRQKLKQQMKAATAVRFISLFYNICIESHTVDFDTVPLSRLLSKVEVALCHYEFTRFRSSVVALSVLSCELEDILARDPSLNAWMSTILALQTFCKIDDCELVHCRSMLVDVLEVYYLQPCKVPKIHIIWRLSPRTSHQLRPSSRRCKSLPTIYEAKDLTDYTENKACDDAAPLSVSLEDTTTATLESLMEKSGKVTKKLKKKKLPKIAESVWTKFPKKRIIAFKWSICRLPENRDYCFDESTSDKEEDTL